MPLWVDDVEAHVVQRFADGDVGQLVAHGKGGCEDGALGGAVAIVQGVGRGWNERGQFLAAHREVAQRVVLDAGGKLVAHLCGHEGVGDSLALKVFVDGNQVEPDFFGDDMHLGPACECRVHIHHAGIKAITGVGRHATALTQVVVTLEPIAEGHNVLVFELTPFGHTRRARCVEQDEQRVRPDGHLWRLCLWQRLDLAGEQHRPGVFVHHGPQFLAGDEKPSLGVFHHEVETLFGIGGVERLIGASGFQNTYRGNGHPFAPGNEHRHHVAVSKAQ